MTDETLVPDVESIIRNPQKIKNIGSHELVSVYLEAALKNETLFLNFLQTLYAHAPWAMKVIIMSAPDGVYGIRDLFRNELQYIMPEPKYKYGSQTIYYFLSEIERMYQNRSVLNPERRKQLLYKATEVLNNDDYKVFLMIMNNEINSKVYKYINKFYNDSNLPENIYKYFLFSLNPSVLHSVPDGIFRNDTNSETMYIPNGEISYYLVFDNIFFELSNGFKEKRCIDFVNSMTPELQAKLFAFAQHTMDTINEAAIVMVNDSDIIGQITKTGIHIFKNPSVISETAFFLKMCNGLKSAFVMGADGTVTGTIGYNNKTITESTVEIESFTVSPLPLFGFGLSVITCKKRESEESFFVIATSESTKKIPENTKKLKLASLCSQFYYVR